MRRVIYAVILAGTFNLCAGAQTLADMARRERARRQNAPKKTIITTGMIRSSSSADAPTPDPTTTKEANAPAAVASPVEATPQQEGRDEKAWRAEFDKARADVQRAENQVSVLENELKTVNRDFLQTAFDPNNSGRAAIAQTTARLETAKKDLEVARGRISQLQEELRQAGAPAGWAR